MTTGSGARKLADRLNHLFATVHPAGSGPYNNEQVAQATGVSRAYIGLLRKGLRDNPTFQTLEALAQFFGVKPSYFFDDQVAQTVDAQLGVLVALRDTRVRALALRAAELSDRGFTVVADMIEHVRMLEGLSIEDDDRATPERQRREGTGADDRADG